MICKGKSIAHTSNAISYGIGKLDSREICREGLGGANAQEIAQEMHLIQQQNSKCINNLLRIELSPTIEDGRTLTDQDWESIALDFMNQMNLRDNRQWICILHNDRAHRHLHIYANRINYDGAAYNDSYFTLKCGKIAEQIAIKRGLTTAMSVHQERQRALQPLKDKILQAHRAIARRGLSPSQYQSLMNQQGVGVIFNQSKTTDRITGMSYIVSDTKIKASSVSRNLGYNKLFGAPKELSPRKLSPRQRLMRQSPVRVGSIKHDIDRLLGYGVQAHIKPEQTDEEYEIKNKLDFEL